MDADIGYLWCQRCSHMTYGYRCGHCQAANGCIERIGPTIEEVKTWAKRAARPASDSDCAGCGRPIRKHKTERHYGSSSGQGIGTRFGVLTSYANPPRPGDATDYVASGVKGVPGRLVGKGQTVAVCDCPPNRQYREKYGR